MSALGEFMRYKRSHLLAFALGYILSFCYFRFDGSARQGSASLHGAFFTTFEESRTVRDPVTDGARGDAHTDGGLNLSVIANAIQKYHWESGLEDVFLLVIVKSAPGNEERRQAIREGWFIVNPDTLHAVPNRLTRQYFVVGQVTDSAVEDRLHAEQKKHSDLLRAPLPDGYASLTVKSMWSLSFAVSNHDFQYLLMADDDTFVNWHMFLPWLARSPQENFYAGRLHSHAKVERNLKSKWYVPHDVLASDFYPPFALGMGYVMSFDVVDKVVDIGRQRPLLGIDDAMIGCLVKEVQVVPRHEEKIKVRWDCHDGTPYIVGGLSAKDMRIFGNRARQKQKIC